MKLILHFSDHTDREFSETPPPDAPDLSMYRQVKHDFEVAGIEGEIQRIRLPETVKTLDDHFVPLSEDWQWYWFHLMVLSYTDYVTWDERTLTAADRDFLKRAWRSVTDNERALTNGHGSGNCKDYINRENLTMQDMAIETLTMGGNVVHMLGFDSLYVTVEALQGGLSVAPPGVTLINRKTRPDLIHVCTNVAGEAMHIDPFWQLGGKDVPFPFISKRPPNKIRVVRLKPVLVYPPDPYYPPR